MLQAFGLASKIVQLHVMHSWGGGLERWVQDYCRTDTTRTNIVLKSLGIPGLPGQKIALYQHIDDETPTRIWELTSPIRATSVTNVDYCYLLDEILSSFNVSGIVISSFIGHSLDILNTGIETIIICHDYYPFCPAINIYFEKICTECKFSDLQRCFNTNKYNRYFPAMSASEWMLIRENFINLILHYQITLVVPSLSVKHHLIQLEQAFGDANFVLIGHGIDWRIKKQIKFFAKSNQNEKIKILVMGRLSLHKGLDLLKEIYKEIIEIAEIFLLGCGNEASSLEGINGINIVAQNYSLADLPEIIEKISPDIGLLLSVWPETFSYTLSELILLGIPTLATKIGSFEDRIIDGVNGFLVEPQKDAVIKKIKDLSRHRDLILQVAENLLSKSHRSLKEMVDDYHKVMSCTTATRTKTSWEINLRQITQVELERSQSQLQYTQVELERSQSQLQQTLVKLEQERSLVRHIQAEVERSQSQSRLVEIVHEKLQRKLKQTQAEIISIKSSKTWKFKEQLKSLVFQGYLHNIKRFVFYIDSPSNQEVFNSDLKIIGWCFSTDSLGIKAVSATIAGKQFEGVYGLHRPDVALAHSATPDAETSGFEISIHLSPGEYKIAIEVVDILDRKYVINSRLVTVSTSPQQLIPNRLNFGRKSFKELKEWAKFANLVRKKALEKQRKLGRTPSLKDIPKVARWLKSLYQEKNRQISALMPPPDFIIPQPLDAYEAWLAVNQWNEKASNHLKNRLKTCQGVLPKISVVMPVYNPQVRFLDIAIANVVNQVYQNWELCIADDCSTDAAVQATLNNWVAKDNRIRVIFRKENGNISVATNSAATLATEDFILFLDHDDELTPDALGEVALYLAEHPETDFLYSDDDKIDTEGRRFAPQFKPDWSPELLLSYMYLSHLCVVRRSIFDKVGGLRVGFEGSQDYDFALRSTEISREVAHLPLILYHWRAVPGSTALSGAAKPASFAAGQKALQEALERRRICGTVYQPEWAVKGGVGIFEHRFPDTGPSVTIIIPTKNKFELLQKCVSSLEKTTYQNYQVVIIDNESDDSQTIAYLESLSDQVLKIKNPSTGFSFAAINNRAVEQINTDYILFLNNDTEVISPNWLSQMVGYANFAGVGAVGAKLLYPDQRIQHAGVIHGLHNGLANHAFKLLPNWDSGYLSYTKVVRNYSAVTAACLLTPRQLFLELQGFDEEDFAVAYNDADYCYRLLEKQYRCVYCPTAELIHYEGISRGYVDNPKERVAYRRKYAQKIDSFYNPHLSLEDEQFRLQARRIVPHEVLPFKVLMCSNALNLTGAPNTQYEIAINLAAAGLIKPIVFSVSDGPLRQAYEEHGIEVIIYEHPLARGYNLEEYEQSLKNLQKEIERHQVDVIYGNTLETFFIIDCAQKMNIPCVWNIHESESWQTYFNYYGSPIAKRALECFSIPYKIIFGSNATREQYLALNSRHNFTVIHSVLDLNRLTEAALKWNRADARQCLNVNEKEIVILLVGTVCERKGQQELVRAISNLPSEWHNRIKCFIVGDRPSEYSNQLHAMVAALPKELKSRISLIPETLEVAKYYQAADIFVCTSRIECFPRVTLEAMAYGLPIVTTPVFGIKEQVQNKVNGIFYTPGSHEELRNAILSLLENDALRKRLAENSRHVSDSLMTLKEMIHNYGEIFGEAYFTTED